MVLTHWLDLFFKTRRRCRRTVTASSRVRRRPDSPALAAHVDVLEDRTLLATFVVNTTDDTVDANPGDGIAQDAGGNTSVRAAIMEANALAGADEIVVPAGNYTLTISGKYEDLAVTGDLDVLDDLTMTGDGAGLTIIDANGIDRVLQVHSGTSTDAVELALTGVSVTGGEVNGGPVQLEDRGGGLYSYPDTQVTVSGVLFHDNAAPRITVETNFGHGRGGAIYSRGDLTILDSRFEDNLATGSGGAVEAANRDASTQIRRTTFANNVGDRGGAVIVVGNVIIEECLFVGNSDREDTHGLGGALYVLIYGLTEVTNSTFTGNTSDNGGAITINGPARINSSTITNNTANLGGGIYNVNGVGDLTIENSIIAGNTDPWQRDVSGTITSAGHNLVGNTFGSTGFGAAGDLLNVDPLLGPLADNSGPTLTHALLQGSPALGAANTATAPPTDQRGIPRPQNGDADVGAFEYADLLTITIDMASISENGGTAVGTVTRNVTTGRRVITLTSSDETEATVTATVTLNNNQASGTFSITGVDDSVADGTQTVTLTASANDFVDGTATIHVTDDEIAALTLAIEPASISENGGAATGTVTRNTPTTDDQIVTLASSDETEAAVPATVTIPAGQVSATFAIDGVDDAIVDGAQSVTITATAGGFVDGTDTLDVADDDVPTLTLLIDTSAISENGGSTTGTVARNTPTTGDLVVMLASSDETAATVPATVTIPAGQTSAAFPITGVDDVIADGTQTVTVTGSAAGFADGADTLDVTDNEVPTLTVSIDLAEIEENGGAATGTVTRNTPTIGDLVVTLISDDVTEASVPATVTIPTGQASATFPISGVDDPVVDGRQTVTITASAAGFLNGTDMIDVTDEDVVPSLTIFIDVDEISENGGAATGTVTRNTPAIGNLIVTLASDDTTEATVPATVTILDGQTSATFPINAVDDDFVDGTQAATFTASSSGFVDGLAALSVIDDEFITLSIDPTSIDEQGSATGMVTRSGSPIGELLVVLSSSDESEATVPGSITIPDGSNSATFTVFAADDTEVDGTQTATITASAVIDGAFGIDTTFGGTGIVEVDNDIEISYPHAAIAIQPDGKIIAASEHPDNRSWILTRTNPDGTPDTTFGTNGVAVNAVSDSANYPVPFDVVVQRDGRILVGGRISSGFLTEVVARFNEDGTLDQSFGTAGVADFLDSTSGWVEELALLDDGRIVAVIAQSGAAMTRMARLHSDGTLDATFGAGGETSFPTGSGESLEVTPNGQYLVVGSSTTHVYVSRVNEDGTLDPTFGTNGTHTQPVPNAFEIAGIRLQSDGRIVVGLSARFDGSETDQNVGAFRLLPDGGLDATYGDAGFAVVDLPLEEYARAMVLHPHGAVTLVAYSDDGSFNRDLLLVRFTPDGDPDPIVGADGFHIEPLPFHPDPFLLNAARHSDGRLVVYAVDSGQHILVGFQGGDNVLAAQATIDVTDDEVPKLSLSINGTSMSENGGTATGTVTRQHVPTTGDLVVTLTSSDESEATVATTVTIRDGYASVSFPITAVDDAIADGPRSVRFTATAGGFVDGTDSIRVTDDEVAELTLSVTPILIGENGGTAAGTVTRNTPNTGELVVMLTSDDTTEAVVPATVTIPAGMNAATFTITAVDDPIGDGTQNVTLTAVASGLADGVVVLGVTDDEPATPVTLTVDTFVDESDGDFSPGDLSLREAIELTNENVGADTIRFDLSLAGGSIVLGGTELLMTDDVTIEGLGAGQLTVDGGMSSRILHVDSATIEQIEVFITGLTLTGGFETDSSRLGGALYNNGELVTLAASVVSNNAAYNGGGIFNDTGSEMIVTDSTLSGNSSTYTDDFPFNEGGGAVLNDGLLTVVDSTISGNSSGWRGGGIFNSANGSLFATRSTFSNNTTQRQGGGVYNGLGIVTVTASTLSNNTAVNLGGGGIASSGGQVAVIGSTLTSNSATRFGGGITLLQSSELTVLNSTLSGNSAGDGGGGISIVSGTATVINSTLSGNSADISGGGISTRSGTATVISSTIVFNRAGADGNPDALGGGVHASDVTTLHNTIVAGNLRGAPGSDGPHDLGGTNFDPASSHNLIGDAASSSGLTHGVSGNIVGNAGVGTIPIGTILDTTLADNGGPTLTHALVVGSPAIDGGDTAEAVDENGTPLVTDQRNYVRIIGASVDVGAVEAASTPLPPAVVVNAGSANRSGINTLTLLFSGPVTLSGPEVLTLINHTTGAVVVVTGVTLEGNGTAEITWKFNGFDLPDGWYSAELPAGAATPRLAQTHTVLFSKLFGDGDGDARVNFNDSAPLSANFGATTGVPFSDGDGDGDGLVNFNDTVPLSANFGASLSPLTYDFGDAPEAGAFFPTTLARAGARHVITGNTLRLSASRDAEPDGQPNADASGDGADEDGVVLNPIVRGTNVAVTVTSSGPGFLNGWIDFNADGDWDDAGEQVITDSPVVNGSNNLQISVPAGASLGSTFARFRLTGTAGYSHFGLAPDGEVEDYVVDVVEPTPDLPASDGQESRPARVVRTVRNRALPERPIFIPTPTFATFENPLSRFSTSGESRTTGR